MNKIFLIFFHFDVIPTAVHICHLNYLYCTKKISKKTV